MLADELKAVLRGDVVTDEATLDAHSTDASIFKVKPKVVVYPKDVEDVKALVKFAVAKKKKGEDISLTGRSAGTDMGGGPLNTSVIVDFTRYFNHIIEVTDQTAVAEPGVYYRDLEAQMNKRGVMLPSYPASKGLCAIGGIVSNNSGGEKTLAFGKTERYVEELHVVMEDGEEHVVRPLGEKELKAKTAEKGFEGGIYKKLFALVSKNDKLLQQARPQVSKNSAGYFLWNVWDGTTFDMNKVIVGSQGTLCLVTRAKFRLVKKPKHSRLVVIFLNNLDPLTDIVHKVLPYKPESFESFDDNTFKLAIKFLPDIMRLMKGNVFSLGLQFLPEALMVLRGGIPKLLLIVELTDDDPERLDDRLHRLAEEVRSDHVQVRITATERESEKYWTMRRESFSLLRNKIKDRQTAPFIDDFAVRPGVLAEFLPRLNKILDKYSSYMVYTIAGHVGDGNFHIIPLMKLHDPATRAVIPEIMDQVYPLVLEYHGTITAEHNDGLVRSPYLKQMYGEKVYKLFEETKAIFDPLNIFNPGKKVNSDQKFALDHIK